MRENLPEGDMAGIVAAVDAPRLARLCRLSADELRELVDFGALQPLPGHADGPQRFSASCIPGLCEAARMRRIFDLDLFTMVLLLDSLDRVARLEAEVHTLRSRLPPEPGPRREGPGCWHEPHG